MCKFWTVSAIKNDRTYVFTFSTENAAHTMAKCLLIDGCEIVEVIDPE